VPRSYEESTGCRRARVRPPVGFRSLQTCDLTGWDGESDAPGLVDLIEAVARTLGHRKGLRLQPLELAAVLGRPKRHPDLGATVNLTCELVNELDRDAELRWLEGTASGPAGHTYELTWRLLYDVVGGTEHIRRIDPDATVRVGALRTLKTGVQLQAPVLSNAVAWPAGSYRFELRGWVGRGRGEPCNLRTTFVAALDEMGAGQLAWLVVASDSTWEGLRASDDAIGVAFSIRRVSSAVPAS
jgi:hypothetical protein